MAIINNNVQNVKFLRNQDVNITRDAAISLLNTHKEDAADGTALLARYTVSGTVKTIVGFVYVTGSTHDITIFDTEGASGDVEKLREEINAKLGTGITSGNTATAQLTALSGTSTDASGVTSVWGAKAYADAKISELDVTAITAGEGQFIKSVSQADGKVSATTADMPTVQTVTENGKPIIAVAENKGTIAASAGTINAEYVNVTGNTFTSTTVQGALEEVESDYKAAIEGLDYTGVTTGDGVVITNVTENNGVVSATSANVGGLKLTDYTKGSDSGSVVTTDSINQAFSKLEKQIDAEKDARAAAIEGLDKSDNAVPKKFVTSVSEENGVISVSRGEVTSTDKTVVLADGSDGGIDLAVHIDGVTLEKNEDGVISVTSSALVQYEGDGDTVQISGVNQGVRTVSSPLTISATTPTDSNVREQYNLVGASGNTIGATIKIYKDSALYRVYLGHVDDTITSATDPTVIPGTGDTALCFIYHKEDDTYEIVTVNVEDFIEENEFASGVTWDSGATKVRGVVDPTSEGFLTVGTDGFKLDGVQNAINTAVKTLDADVNGNSTHVTVGVVEEDGVITAVTVSETNIANANDLASLSAKTITDVKSANGSVTVTPTNAADGTKEIDLATDADKIKMSGFSADATSALSGISEDDSIATAFENTNTVITENERVTAAALTDLDTRLDKVEDEYISGITVNGSGVTVSDNAAALTLASAPSTGAAGTPIIVETSNNGGITLKFDGLDCGFYA